MIERRILIVNHRRKFLKSNVHSDCLVMRHLKSTPFVDDNFYSPDFLSNITLLGECRRWSVAFVKGEIETLFCQLSQVIASAVPEACSRFLAFVRRQTFDPYLVRNPAVCQNQSSASTLNPTRKTKCASIKFVCPTPPTNSARANSHIKRLACS